MTRKEYTDTVLSTLRHVTGDEKAAIRKELEAHMEDHMEALLALDYPQELAEERTLSAMGDPVGDDILRVYQVNVGPDSEVPGGYQAEVLVCAYDRIPGGIVSQSLTREVLLENARGETSTYNSGSGSWRVEYARLYTPLQPGDTFVALEYEGFGEQVFLELPLPGGGIP